MENHVYVPDVLTQLGKKYFGSNDRYTAIVHNGMDSTYALVVYDFDVDADDWFVRIKWTKGCDPTLEVRYLDEIASTNNRHSAVIDNHMFELLKLLDQARNDIREIVGKTEVDFS